MYTYYYNASDTLPFKSRHIDVSLNSSDTTITYHFYDANKNNLKDSSILSLLNTGPLGSYIFLTQVARYSYATGKKYSHTDITYILPSPGTDLREDTAILDSRNNILSCKANFSFTSLQNTSSLSYDNKISPFSLLSNFKAHQRFPSGETLFFEYFSYNNILSLSETNQGSPINTTHYAYTYKPDGLPKTVTMTYNNLPDTTRLLYSYKKL